MSARALFAHLSPFVVVAAACSAARQTPTSALPTQDLVVAAAGAVPGDGALGSEPATEPTAERPGTAPLPPWMMSAAEKIVAHNRGKTRAWDRLAEMVDTFGPRLSGSKALERAIDWSLEQMREDGLVNVRREKVMVPHWVRGRERLRVTAPVERELVMLGLGMSVGTRGVLRAPIAVVDHVDQIAGRDDLEGKIVLIDQAMPPYDAETRDTHYGDAVAARTRGASEAAKRGAKAVLVRSVTAHSLNTPHTGALRYAEDAPKIPAAAVTPEGAALLRRLAARGEVEVALEMGAKQLPDAESGNAIGEIVGTEKPDEIVLIGAHIDSWDVGDGASDDGSGCVMAMEAARMLVELGLVPRRTIRVVLFTNEENGLRGGKEYFAAHGYERHVAAIEADIGAGAPWGFSVAAQDEREVAQLEPWAVLFQPLGADHVIAGWAGADISPLVEAGVLGLALRPDDSHYFDLHHSPADTIDKIDPGHLQSNAAAMALMAYLLAQRE